MFSHRNKDARSCGALTTAIGQDFVIIDGQAWAVNGDPNTDGGGGLIPSKTWVTINGKGVIVKNDSAVADSLCIPVGGAHCNPSAVGYSDLVDIN